MPQVTDPIFVSLINGRAYAALQTERRNGPNSAYEWARPAWLDQPNTFAVGPQTFQGSVAINSTAFIQNQASTTIPLTVKGFTGQSASLQEWRDVNNTVLASVSATGVFSGNGSGLTNLPGGAVTLTGDVTGTGMGSIVTTLAASGVASGTYNNVTVNAKGLVTGGSALGYALLASANTFTAANTFNASPLMPFGTTSGNANVRLGPGTGNNTATGNDNVCLGDAPGTALTTGHDNFLACYHAGNAITSGGENIAIGDSAGSNIVTSNGCIHIGYAAHGTGDNGHSICIGYQALSTGTGSCVAIGTNAQAGTNGVAIGYGVSTGGNATIRIGFNGAASGASVIHLGQGNSTAQRAALLYPCAGPDPPVLDNTLLFGVDITDPQIVLTRWSSTSTPRQLVALHGEWSDSTDATRKARMRLTAYDSGGEREGLQIGTSGSAPTVGFYGSAGTAKPTITGSKGGNIALGNLLASLAALGLVIDSTT